MLVRSFRVDDLAQYRGRTVEAGAQQWLEADGLDQLEADPLGRTIVIDGTPVASGGFVPLGKTSAVAWAVLAPVARENVFRLQTVFRDTLAQAGRRFWRVETHVELSFMLSHRWVRTIGFDLDQAHPSLFALGKTFARYVYVGNRT